MKIPVNNPLPAPMSCGAGEGAEEGEGSVCGERIPNLGKRDHHCWKPKYPQRRHSKIYNQCLKNLVMWLDKRLIYGLNCVSIY